MAPMNIGSSSSVVPSAPKAVTRWSAMTAIGVALAATSLVALVGCKKGEKAETQAAVGTKEIRITVDAVGYHPAEARAPGGKPVRLVVTRTVEDACGEEFVVPSVGIKKKLPVNEPVAIDLTMPTSGKLAFMCGMDMMRGTIIAD